MQARFVAELRKQMGVLLLIFGVVSLSAVLLIFCIFYMIVETRRKDIAIMKSCGADSVVDRDDFCRVRRVCRDAGNIVRNSAGYIVTKNISGRGVDKSRVRSETVEGERLYVQQDTERG